MCGCLTAPRMQHLDGPGISRRGGLNSATGAGQDGNAGEGGMEGEKSAPKSHKGVAPCGSSEDDIEATEGSGELDRGRGAVPSVQPTFHAVEHYSVTLG